MVMGKEMKGPWSCVQITTKNANCTMSTVAFTAIFSVFLFYMFKFAYIKYLLIYNLFQINVSRIESMLTLFVYNKL